MSYTTGYYVADFIAALRGLSWLMFLASILLAGYLFVQGKMLEQQQKPSDEPLGSLVDWTNGGKMKKWGILVISIATPLLYIISHMLPESRTAMIHMGFAQDVPCMTGDQTGVLLEGTSIGNTFHGSFMMKDKVAIMCQIDNMNASGAKRNTVYRVLNGKLVS